MHGSSAPAGEASVLAALAAAMAPALVALTTILTTETFEPITWTACAYFLTRAIVRERPINLLWAALVAGVAMEVKYGMAIWLIALAIGILLTQTRLYAKRHLWLAVAVVAILSAPSLIWQAMHDWAFIAVTIEHKKGNFTGTPLSFAIGQAFAINIALAPLWIAGLIAPFVGSRLKEARPVAIAFVAAAVLIFVTHGKDYYLFPAYPALFAIGAAAAGALPTWLRTVWISLAIANSALLAPIVLPILDPPALAAYMARAHLSPLPDEAAAVGAPLTQVFSDEMGWRELEQQVAKVYRALPPEDRTHAAIIASNYGEAAAIDVYGRVDGLPPALSGQNQYFLWGPRGFDGSVIIHINGDMDRWRYACESVELAGTFGVPYAMPYERDRPIFICRNLHGGLAAAWAKFKRYR